MPASEGFACGEDGGGSEELLWGGHVPVVEEAGTLSVVGDFGEGELLGSAGRMAERAGDVFDGASVPDAWLGPIDGVPTDGTGPAVLCRVRVVVEGERE